MRAVELVALDQSKRTIRLKRPFRNLYPLGMSCDVVETKAKDPIPEITTILGEDVAEHIN